MNFSKHPFSSFGVDFVILFFECCIAAMPLGRGLELHISVDCDLLWSVWAFVLQLLLGSLSMLKVFLGYYSECLCNVYVPYLLSLFVIIQHFGDFGFLFPQSIQFFPIWMHIMGCGFSCDAPIAFCVGWCWVVMGFQDMYVSSLQYARSQSLYFSTMTR